MTTPHHPAQAPTETPEAVAETVLAGREELLPGSEQSEDLPRVGAWTVTVFTLMQFGFALTLLVPAMFSLAYKVQEIDPANKDSSLGYVVGFGGLVALVAGPVAGVLSDGTRLRWGRRRPYIAIGLVLAALGALILAAAPTVWMMVVGYSVAGLATAAASAAINPFIAERVPSTQRGVVGALGGAGAAVAGIGSGLFGSFLTGSAYALFLAPVVVFGVVALVYLLVIPDRPAPESARIGSVVDVFKSLWFNPVKHSDFALVWVGKFCIQFGYAFTTTYGLYFLQDRFSLTAESAARQLAWVGIVGLLALVASALIGGMLSDRVGRRKPFIYVAAGQIAIGIATSAFAPSILIYALGGLLIAAGTGIFISVDLALATDVLPDRSQAGKYMSIFHLAAGVGGVIGPLIAPAILRLGGGGNYTVLYLSGAILALGAVVTTARVRGVR